MRIDFRKKERSSAELRWIRLQRATHSVVGCLIVAGISVFAAASIESADQHLLDILAGYVQPTTVPVARL